MNQSINAFMGEIKDFVLVESQLEPGFSYYIHTLHDSSLDGDQMPLRVPKGGYLLSHIIDNDLTSLKGYVGKTLVFSLRGGGYIAGVLDGLEFTSGFGITATLKRIEEPDRQHYSYAPVPISEILVAFEADTVLDSGDIRHIEL